MIRSGIGWLTALTSATAICCTAPSRAQEVLVGPETWSVALHHLDVHPRSAGAARAPLDRLGDAAMRACGASSFSLREVKAAVRHSTCWRESMADVVARIDDPELASVYESGYGRQKHSPSTEHRP